MRKQVKAEYWICIIGATNSKNLKSGADSPMRNAVQKAFEETTGKEDDREIGTLFTHRAGPDIGTGQFKMPSRNLGLQEESFFSRKDGLKEEARDYKTNKENPSGDLLELPRYETSDKEDLPYGT